MMFKAAAVLVLLFAALAVESRAHQPHDPIHTVAVSPDFFNDRTVFCSLTHINTFILKSTDGGNSWQPSQIGLPNLIVRCLACSPGFRSDGAVFAGTNTGEILKSSDSGASWELVLDGATYVTQIACSPEFLDDQTVFAATEDSGALKSTDGGATWSPINTGLSDLRVQCLAVSPSFATDRTLFAGTQTGLFKSTDGGDTWFKSWSSQPLSLVVADVELSPRYSQDETVFAATWGWGVFKSEDGGNDFSNVTHEISEPYVRDLQLSPDYEQDGTVFAATQEAGIFKSYTGGASWILINEGLNPPWPATNSHYFELGISPNFKHDRVVFAATYEGLHRSHTDATKWLYLAVYNRNITRYVATSPNFVNDGTVYAGTYGGGMYRSEDMGSSWESVNTNLINSHVGSVVISPDYATDETIFMGAFPDAMKSTCKGEDWARLDLNLLDKVYARTAAISPNYAVDQTMIFGNGTEGVYPLFLTTDGGSSFTPIAAPFKVVRFIVFSPDYAVDQTVFVATGSGIFRSQDGGCTYSLAGLQGSDLYGLAVSPSFACDGVVFAGCIDGGLFRSTDGGDTWSAVNSGIPATAAIEAIAVSPGFVSDRCVFAATKSHGIFRSVDGGTNWICAGLKGTFVRSMALSPNFELDGISFAGAWDGVYRSTDRGRTWERVLKTMRIDDKDRLIVYQDDWIEARKGFCNGTTCRCASDSQAKLGLFFYGTGISWIGPKAARCGIAKVYIDSTLQGYVDLYSPNVKWQEVLFKKSDLDLGGHTIYIEVTGYAGPNATDTVVAFDAFEIEY